MPCMVSSAGVVGAVWHGKVSRSVCCWCCCRGVSGQVALCHANTTGLPAEAWYLVPSTMLGLACLLDVVGVGGVLRHGTVR